MPESDSSREWIKFRHARFTARFPSDFRYSPSHYWMMRVPEEPGVWRVGFTKFATRMLGELVDFTFNIPEGGEVAPGEMIGWVEGFKAASDVFCVMTGQFAGSNPALRADACIVRSDPYLEGWLYAVRGEPEPENLDAAGYIELLNTIITKMASEEHAAE
ncbi:MAG: glycine cleavage system protein H [Verrucomicrobiota bacterium]